MRTVPVNLQDVSEAEFIKVFRELLTSGGFVYTSFDGEVTYDATDFLQNIYDILQVKKLIINNALHHTTIALTELKNGNR